MLRTPPKRLYSGKLDKSNLGTVKLKSVMCVRQINSKWADLWNTWNWESWVRPQIDVSIAAGANCIKMAGSGINPEDGYSYPSDTVLKARIDQFIGYCQSKGVAVYWNLVAHPTYLFGFDGSAGAANMPSIVKVAKWLDAWPNVVAIDVCNEINNTFPTSWNGPNYTQVAVDLKAACDAVRTVTSLPLACSVLCQNAAEITGSWMQAVAPFVDFHTFHPYFTGATPSVANLTALRAAPWYKGRHLVDELGTSLAQTSGVQTTWTQNLGVMAAEPDAFGAILFCAADYDTANAGVQFGMYDTRVQNPRSQLITPFSAWGGQL